MKRTRLRASRMLLLVGVVALAAGALALADAHEVQAVSSYLSTFRTTYPAARGSALDSCSLCHPGGVTTALNTYATDFAAAGHVFTTIESLDSDGDGYSNLAEITALTLPGDPNSHPGGTTATPTDTPANTPMATRTPTATNTPNGMPTQTPTASRTPVATRTGPPPSPTATSAPVARRAAFLGTVTDYPEGRAPTGTWRVGSRTVYVTAGTWIERSDLLSEHALIWVFGARRTDGSVDARYIRILQPGSGDDHVRTSNDTATPANDATVDPGAALQPDGQAQPGQAPAEQAPGGAGTPIPDPGR